MTEDRVAFQYEAYPYPHRDPREERRRLVTGSPSQLDELRHYVFAGRPVPGLRALVAGGGTGDAAIMLAQQLTDAAGEDGDPGEVVYLDISAKAREIAEARAAVRGLRNIAFHTGPLEDLPELDLGRFDYIDCCGVLHHLPDPPAGLRALSGVLKDGGGIGLMVYAPDGRTGVYPMQEMLRTLGGLDDLGRGIQLARRLWSALPQTNWLRRNPFVGDHKRSDAELVDLFLHARDRPYTVEQLADLLAAAALRPAGLLEPARYDPTTYLSDPALLGPLEELDWLQRAAFTERLAGNLKKHVSYAVPAPRGDTVAQLDDAAVPRLLGLDGPELAAGLGRGDPRLKVNFDGVTLRLHLPRRAGAFLHRLDGHRSVGEIVAAACAGDSGLTPERARQQFTETYRALNRVNRMVLHRPD